MSARVPAGLRAEYDQLAAEVRDLDSRLVDLIARFRDVCDRAAPYDGEEHDRLDMEMHWWMWVIRHRTAWFATHAPTERFVLEGMAEYGLPAEAVEWARQERDTADWT